MKKLIYILLFSILSIASYGQTCVATGTTKAGKLGMCSPSLGAASDSVVVWNATGERLLKYIPRSSFNELTADELAAIQNANAPNAGNPFATVNDIDGVVLSVTGTTVNNTDPVNPIVNVPTMEQTATAGNEISLSVLFGSVDTGDYTSIYGPYLEMYDSIIPNYIGVSPSLGFKTGSDVSENSLNSSGLDLNGDASTGQKVTYQNTAQTTAGVYYDVIDRAAGTYHVAAIEDLTGFGTGTVTTVTGTNGVTVASGTSTPVIGLGNITPIKVNGITLSGSSTPALAVTGTASVSGANTGDQDLSALELKANKQNSLAADGTGNKYITVDAVRKLTAFVNLEIFFFQTGTDAPTLNVVNNPTTATITATRVDVADYRITASLPIFSGNCWPGNDPGFTIISNPNDSVNGPKGVTYYKISDYEYRVRTGSDLYGSFEEGTLVEPVLLTIKIPF